VEAERCNLCDKEKVLSFSENYCPDCDGEWYCHVGSNERESTERLLGGPQYVYATKNLREAWRMAGPYGSVCAVKRYGDVPIDRELHFWFSVYGTFTRWVEDQTHRQVRGSQPPATQRLGRSSF